MILSKHERIAAAVAVIIAIVAPVICTSLDRAADLVQIETVYAESVEITVRETEGAKQAFFEGTEASNVHESEKDEGYGGVDEPETSEESVQEEEWAQPAPETINDDSVASPGKTLGYNQSNMSDHNANDGSVQRSVKETAGDNGFVAYAVNGAKLSEYLQRYLYDRLKSFGCEWFYPVALCQIYQESRFKANAVSPDGKDVGLCQFREQYWEYHARLSGLYEYDIWNPIDQLWVYAWLMSENLRKSCGDVGMALSRYYLGEATYCEKYVRDVMQWMQTMEVR